MPDERPCFAGDNLVQEAEGWRCRVCDTLWPAADVWWPEGDRHQGTLEDEPHA